MDKKPSCKLRVTSDELIEGRVSSVEC